MIPVKRETQPGRRPMLKMPEPGKGSLHGFNCPRGDVPMETLIIDRNDSTCNACGGGARPDEKSHESLLGWPPVSHELGCGVVWTHLSSNYAGDENDRAVQDMRPDLVWQAFTWPGKT
jgi:hypothetical protein